MDITSKLVEPESIERPFGNYQEEAIVSLALDHPEFFTDVGRFLKPPMFGRFECQWVMAEILNCFEKHDVVPTRKLLRDTVLGTMTEDDPYDEVLAIISVCDTGLDPAMTVQQVVPFNLSGNITPRACDRKSVHGEFL